MESNGTRAVDGAVDWLTVSPKPQFHPASIALVDGLPISELKVVIDDTVDDAVLARYEQRYRCSHYFAQPCMNDDYQHHLQRTLALVQARPSWRVVLPPPKIFGGPRHHPA